MSEELSPSGQKKTILSARIVAGLDNTFGIAAGVVLFILMIVVTVDVIGRYVFSSPLRGSFEYIQIGMAMLVFLALPVVVAREENVQVEVFEVLIPKPIRHLARMLGFVLSAMAAIGLAYVSYLRAISFHSSGERFMLLPAQLYPVAYFIFAMWAVCVVIMIFQFSGFWKSSKVAENDQ